MKKIKVAFLGVSVSDEVKSIAREFQIELRSFEQNNRDFEIYSPDVVVADASHVSNIFAKMPREGRPSIFVAAPDSKGSLPTVLDAGLADDLLSLPIRRLDFLAKLRWHGYLKSIRAIEGINDDVNRMIQRLEADLVFAQKIQRRLIKDRFPPMSGISVKSKYWCGMKGGGDYFDVFEFADKNTVGFLLTDVSSYKLSSAFISTMMHLPASLGPEDMRDPVRTVGFIHSELLDRMGATDHMSIFYGVLDRKSFQMRYVAFGNLSLAFESARRERNWIYRSARSPLSSGSGELISRTKVDEMNFEPEDRLYLFSDGVEEGVGKAVPSFLDAIQDRDPQAVINEVSFAIRTQHDPKGEDGEAPMPPQDCSVLMLDVAKNILRLAR